MKPKDSLIRTRLAWRRSAVAVALLFAADATQALPVATPKPAASASPAVAVPPSAQATDIAQIAGAEITKTAGTITGINIKDCTVLTPADYQLIRKQESLKTLGFAHGPDNASLKILEGMPAIEGFSSNGVAIDDAGIASLATFKTLRGLTFFHPGKGITGTGFTALATLPNLENMTVAGSEAFGDAGMAAVAQLSHLTALRFWHDGNTADGIKPLIALKQLKTLTIGQRLSMKPPSAVNDETIAVLATFPSLESLSVTEARLSLAALSRLAQIPNLKSLSLTDIDISEADVAALKDRLPKTQIKWNAPADQRRIIGMFGPATGTVAPSAPPAMAKKQN